MELESGEQLIEAPLPTVQKETREEITKNQTQIKKILKKQIQNEQRETVQETNIEKETQEQTVYKPRHVDTETLIKGEIKQVILSEASELVNARALNDMFFDIKERTTSLKENAVRLMSENKKLDKQVETDKNKLKRFEVFLFQTNKMIELLKRNVESLVKKIKESHVHEILEKSKKQYADLESLKKTYETQFGNESEKVENMLTAERERNNFLKYELNRQEENLVNFNNKCDELRKTNEFYDEEIATYSAKKQALEEKLENLKTRKISVTKILEDADTNRETLTHKLRLKKENLTTKLANVDTRKREVQQELEDIVQEINALKNESDKAQEEILQKEVELKKLLEELETTKQDQEATIQKLKQEYEDVSSRLQELQTDLVSVKEKNEERNEMLKTLQINYVSKCEEKSLLVDELLKQKQTVHDLELILTKKRVENDMKNATFENLQNQRDTIIHAFETVEANKVKEETAHSQKLADLTTKYELLKKEHDKNLLEMKKKKEYILATSNYLKEKCDSLRQEADKTENVVKNLNQENASLKMAVSKKQTLLNEFKRKLESLKKDDKEAVCKSGLKSKDNNNVMKKVQFNEVPFYKSATESSEASSQVLNEGASQLERSFHEWLEEIVEAEK